MLARLLLASSLLFALASPVEAQTTIPGLPAVSSPAPTDVFAGCPAGGTSGCTKKYTAAQVVHAGGGDGELGNYAPVDAASTNYLFQSNALGTSPWTATNVSVAQSSLIGTSNVGTAWDLTTTSTGGFIQQITPLNSIPADTRTYILSAYFDKTRSTTPWTINFFFTGGPSNTMVYTPGTDTITSCVGGGTCGRQFVGNKVRLYIAAANAGYTRATVKIYPTGTLGTTGLSTVDNVQLEAATGATQLTAPTCINKTTTNAIPRTGVCAQSGASLVGDQTFSGVNTFSNNLIFTRYPTSGNPTMLFGGPTSPISPNNAFVEYDCYAAVSGVCQIVPVQSNQFATSAAVQPYVENWRGHCAVDATFVIADYSACIVHSNDALSLLQSEGADGYAPFSYSVTAATPVSGGSGYTVGDVLTVSGGTISTREGANSVAAQLTVDSVSSGAITAAHVSTLGAYLVQLGTPLPTNPVSVTGGTGTGATFTATFGNHANPTSTNIITQVDSLCGSPSAYNIPGRIKLGVENPYVGIAPNAMNYSVDIRCDNSIVFIGGTTANGGSGGGLYWTPYGTSTRNKFVDLNNGEITPPASTTANAGVNLGVGVAPTSPVNGDLWTTSSGLYARIAGSTVGPFGTGGGGSGSVTSVAVTTANGVSGSVANPTTTPAISLTLGAITPSSVAASGTVTGSNLSGTNTGDQTSVSGNAGTATALQTPRAINGVNFDGTAPITINAVDSTARVPATRTISTTAPLAGGGDLSADRTLSIVAATSSVPGSMSAADKTKLDAITGTNTGDQTITLTGNVTGSGTGSFATTIASSAVTTGTIASSAVTYAKIQNVAASSLVGNPTGSPAAPSEIALGPSFTLSGSTLYGASEHPGYVTGTWYSTVPYATVAAGAAIPLNTIKLVPFTLSKPITISALGARVTTAATSGNFQLAAYANNAATGRPTGTALVATGNISSGSTGAISAAVASNALLNPGTYWAAVNSDNSTAVFQITSSAALTGAYLIGSTTLANITTSSTNVSYNLSVAQTFGTWPDLTSASFTEQTAATYALVFMKAQ